MVVLVLSLWTMGQVLQTQSFDDPAFPPAGWVVTNAGTGNDWTQSTATPYAGAGTMFYGYHTNAADTWAFTPGITLTGGTTCYVEFYQKVESSSYPERLKVTVGQGQTVAAQTTVIWDNAGGSNLTNTTYIKRTASFTPGATGTYNFAFNCYSEAYHWNLYVDEYRLYIPAPVYPMTGIWTVDPGGSGSNNFTTLAAAINYLNYNGVGSGGVTFNVVANYTETFTSPTAGLITASGTSSNPILFKKNGAGSNPLITAGVGTSTTTDGIIVIAGGDFITFENIDLQENSLNTVATTQMEWGYALVKANATAPFNGCQNITIKNCTITLNKANPGSVGIYSGNHIASNTTLLTITDVSDAMNNCKFYGNTISNVYRGIALIGFNAPSPYTLYDSNNEIGVEGPNNITNFGGAAGGTGLTPQVYGIYTWYTSNVQVANNTINGGTGTGTLLYGIRTSSGANGDVYNNIITLTGGSTRTVYGIGSELGTTGSTVNIHHNTIENCSLTTATTGLFYGIQNQIVTTVAFNINIYENEVKNNLLAGTGNFIGIDGGYGGIVDINNNRIHDNTKNNSGQITMIRTGTSGTKYEIHENIMYANNIITVGTVSASCTINGFYCLGSPSEFFYNNQIYDCYVGGTTTGGSTIYGINGYSLNSQSKSFFGNTIRNLAINSGSGTIYGIYFGNVYAGTSYTLYNNKVYDLTAAGTSGAVTGIHIAGGNGLHVYNNFISDLKAPNATGAIAINGMNIAGGSLVNAYYNTIYLNASSTGSTFGSSGIYKSATVNSDFRNNCVVNLSIPGSTGLTVAYRWSGSYNPSNYSTLSNNNNWYAGTPGSSNVIFFDGTERDQTLADFQARVFPKESNSVTENPPFMNVTTTPYDLHISTNIPTFCESSGTPVLTPIPISDDIDGNPRAALPDIGADEFSGTLPPNAVTFSVDMSTAEGFSPGVDLVYIAGNFPGAVWNEPGTNPALMMTQVGSSHIYTLTLSLPGGSVEYKYFRNAGWDGGEWAGEPNRSVTFATNITVNDTWRGSITWANLQWPGTGSINLGGAYEVYAQANIPNGVTTASGATYGLQAWIGYSTDNTDPNTWTNWIPAPFFGQSFDNDEFKADLGSILTESGTYYYASRFQFGNMPYVYGGFSGGFWDGTTNISGVLAVNEATKTLNLTVLLEGLYAIGGTMRKVQGETGDQFPGNVADQVNIELHDGSDYSNTILTLNNVDVNQDGSISVAIPAEYSGNYHITIKHRNSIATTSANPVSFTGSNITYNFNTPTSAFGNNLLQMADGHYVIYGGDVNQDGSVDTGDSTPVDNDQFNFVSGYVNTDVNGDGIIDTGDGTIIDNNQFGFVGAILP